jgi:hypothetical protein
MRRGHRDRCARHETLGRVWVAEAGAGMHLMCWPRQRGPRAGEIAPAAWLSAALANHRAGHVARDAFAAAHAASAHLSAAHGCALCFGGAPRAARLCESHCIWRTYPRTLLCARRRWPELCLASCSEAWRGRARRATVCTPATHFIARTMKLMHICFSAAQLRMCAKLDGPQARQAFEVGNAHQP